MLQISFYLEISFEVKPAVCPAKKPSTTSVDSTSSGASTRNAECEDSPDCAENGIVDIIGCDFTPWAIERCPKTCGTCGLSTRSDEPESNEVCQFSYLLGGLE